MATATPRTDGRPRRVPNRSTSESQLDQFNQWMRAQPWYQNFLRAQGQTGAVRLSRGQQKLLEQEMARRGLRVPGGMHIDNAGNLNQKNRLLRNVGIGAGVAAAAFGVPGAFPGLLTAGGGGAAAGAGAGAGLGALEAGVPLSTLAPSSLPGFVSAGEIAAGLGLAGGAGAGLGGGASEVVRRTAGGGAGEFARRALRVGIPVGAMALMNRGGGRGGDYDPLGGDVGTSINDLLDFSRRRLERSEPVHQAAMDLAMRLAPSGSDARVREASQRALQPSPTHQVDPQVQDAIRRLMGRF